MVSGLIFACGAVTTGVCAANKPPDSPAVEYVSDILTSRASFIQQSWGKLGVDTSVVVPGRGSSPLSIKDKQYKKGLGTHAHSQIELDLNNEFETFEAEVGVKWQNGQSAASVVFQVFVDDEKKFDSGVMREKDDPKPVSVSVAGADEIRLVVTDAGDGINCDVANWGDARLTRSTTATATPSQAPFDVAKFARVATWDPERNDGCRANRVQEFAAEDLFLETDVLPSDDGSYTVPVAANGQGCIGLQWLERRHIKEMALEFAESSHVPDPADVKIQGWVGESLWQGEWKPLEVKINQQGKQWMICVGLSEIHRSGTPGMEKIRFIFPQSPKPIVLRRLSAFAFSKWDTVELKLELESPMAGKSGEIRIYNGAIVEPAGSGAPMSCSWDLAKPLRLKIRYSRPRVSKSDRTVLWFRIPSGNFAAAVEDILENQSIYMPDMGFFITSKPEESTLAGYIKNMPQEEGVLQKVRKMPDQSFQQAMEHIHREVQNNGPTMLSLACDNRKFVVKREGDIRFVVSSERDNKRRMLIVCDRFEMFPKMGSGKNEKLERHLDGEWLPVPVTTITDDGVAYHQRTFVVPYDKADVRTKQEPGWFNNKPLCVVEYTIENTLSEETDASLELKFMEDLEKEQIAEVKQVPEGAVAGKDEWLFAFADAAEADGLKMEAGNGVLSFSGKIPADAQKRFYVYIPGWDMKQEDRKQLTGGEALLADVRAYWEHVLAPAMQIDIPEPLLLNVIRASQVHCLIAARNEADGERISPWIASMSYGPLESEAQSIIRGMSYMGHLEFAQRGLDFFIHRYNPQGFLTTGYTLMGFGWHLWTLGEHYQVEQDSEWLKKVAPEVIRACQWIARQSDKTKQVDAYGEKKPEYGLTPPAVFADWNRFAYYFAVQAHFCNGLYESARALSSINYPGADALFESASEFKGNILKAYKWAQARTPAHELLKGKWIPAYPALLYCHGKVGEMFPGEDGGRAWAKDLHTHNLIPLRILDADSREATWIIENMENDWCLHTGHGEYPEDENRKDWFNMGGFTKMQPYYTRMQDIYALRDDVKPYIRSYFNPIPSLLNLENLSLWEHFHNRGAWNKTHETGWFLGQTRFMFVMERGDELWLAPFITNHWLKDGMTVAIDNAPTHFGEMSYRITSSVGKGFMEAVIQPPKRKSPAKLVIRLRHPDEKPMKKVIVNGKSHTDFDAEKECVYLSPATETITVRAEY